MTTTAVASAATNDADFVYEIIGPVGILSHRLAPKYSE